MMLHTVPSLHWWMSLLGRLTYLKDLTCRGRSLDTLQIPGDLIQNLLLHSPSRSGTRASPIHGCIQLGIRNPYRQSQGSRSLELFWKEHKLPKNEGSHELKSPTISLVIATDNTTTPHSEAMRNKVQLPDDGDEMIVCLDILHQLPDGSETYSLVDSLFSLGRRKWQSNGPYTQTYIDSVFMGYYNATCLNNRLPVYVPDPMVLEVDALLMDWTGCSPMCSSMDSTRQSIPEDRDDRLHPPPDIALTAKQTMVSQTVATTHGRTNPSSLKTRSPTSTSPRPMEINKGTKMKNIAKKAILVVHLK